MPESSPNCGYSLPPVSVSNPTDSMPATAHSSSFSDRSPVTPTEPMTAPSALLA